MATSETTNLQLVKYGAGTDNFIRTDYNGNLDKIDTFAGNTNEAITTLNDNITPLSSTVDATSYTSHVTVAANYILKSAGIVYLMLDMRTESGYKVTSGSTFALIPSDFRPKVTRAYPTRFQINNSEWGDGEITINTNGQISQTISNNFSGCVLTIAYECN